MNFKVTSILLYNSEGRFLLQHRDKGIKNNADKWSFFGGGVEEGESYLECVKREAMEELSYELKNPKLVYESDEGWFGSWRIFVEEYDGKQELILGEGQDWGWFTLEETKKLDMPDYIREKFEMLVRGFLD